jgi:3-dehydroquinate dehydratase/shikimate dehydrogenase
MLAVPIKRAEISLLREAEQYADLIEFRLDLFSDEELHLVPALRKKTKLPLIFTFKTVQDKYVSLLACCPEYIDLPYEIDFTYQGSKRIASYHDFEKTPLEIEPLFLKIQERKADLYKIVTYAKSALDGMRMLHFLRKQTRPLIAFCMGVHGRFSRTCALRYGSFCTFASLSAEEETAPGQLCVQEYAEIKRLKGMNSETKVFALLGNPVEKSPSHRIHNEYFEKREWNCFYTKILLSQEELGPFFMLAQELEFSGFSITTPLKKVVTNYLDNELEVCNTIVCQKGKLLGWNTDGRGALNVIEKRLLVQGKKMAIIGAGSTAHAIGAEAIRRGAHVIFVNRTRAKAETLAKELGADVGLEGCNYDILVQATTVGMRAEEPLSYSHFLPGRLVLEVVQGTTAFLQQALQSGCIVIDGYEMFLEQGRLQYEHFSTCL